LYAGTVMTQGLHGPYGHETDMVRHGITPAGKPRHRCRECRQGCGRTLLLAYPYVGQSSEVQQQIVDRAMNARGMRGTARVLHVSPPTVLKA
jgi:transposase-like protein